MNQEIPSPIPAEKNRKLMNKLINLFFLIILLVFVYKAGYESGNKNISTNSNQLPLDNLSIQEKNKPNVLDFGLFWKSWDLLNEKYVDAEKLDAQKLMYGAIQGMLRATGDPYTSFLDPDENKRFGDDIKGSFEGIGAEMGIKNEILTIVAPLSESPAEKAGLRAGDKVLKIDGKITADMGIEEAVKLIRGEKGTEVTLTIFHEGDSDTRDVVVKRGLINVTSVTYEKKDGGIAYIKVSRFGDDTEKEFNKSIAQALADKSTSVILDLRNNPGGYLETSVEMASKMLPADKIVVIEEGSKGDRKILKTRGKDQLSQLKTVMLINEGSASASEIVAGALKDNRPDNVTLVGKKSFGKGSVQELIDLPSSTAIKITVAKWLTPNGNQINDVGIVPDVEVELSQEDFENDRDPQLDKAIELLKQ